MPALACTEANVFLLQVGRIQHDQSRQLTRSRRCYDLAAKSSFGQQRQTPGQVLEKPPEPPVDPCSYSVDIKDLQKLDQYVKAGEKVGGVEVSVSANENKPGFFGGVGVDFKASPQVKIGVFGKYHDILTEGTSTALITAGVSVGFGMAK